MWSKKEKMKIRKEFDEFSVSHYLPGHGHCGWSHGHNYQLFVTVEGPIHDNGMVMDFADLKRIVKEIIDPLDHPHTDKDKLLNDFGEIFSQHPTAENISKWIFEKIASKLAEEIKDVFVVEVELYETRKNCAIYNGK